MGKMICVIWSIVLTHDLNLRVVYVCGCFVLFNRDTSEDADSLGDASSQPDTVSIASRTSQNTADSDKVQCTHSHL